MGAALIEELFGAPFHEVTFGIWRDRWVRFDDGSDISYRVTEDGAFLEAYEYHVSTDGIIGTHLYPLPAAQAYGLRCAHFAWRLELAAEALAAAAAPADDDEEPF